MKTLVLLGGPMGVGKTATAQQLQKLLAPCVWLEGDWCWRMEPFDPSPANRELVLENIGFLLRNFLQSPSWGTVLFSWVLHEQGIFDRLRRELAGLEYAWRPFSLVCSPQALRQRLEGDIRAGRRTPDVVARSLERLPCYQKLPVPQVDTTHLTPAQAAREVFRLLWGPGGAGEPGPAEKAPGPGGLFRRAGLSGSPRPPEQPEHLPGGLGRGEVGGIHLGDRQLLVTGQALQAAGDHIRRAPARPDIPLQPLAQGLGAAHQAERPPGVLQPRQLPAQPVKDPLLVEHPGEEHRPPAGALQEIAQQKADVFQHQLPVGGAGVEGLHPPAPVPLQPDAGGQQLLQLLGGGGLAHPHGSAQQHQRLHGCWGSSCSPRPKGPRTCAR